MKTSPARGRVTWALAVVALGALCVGPAVATPPKQITRTHQPLRIITACALAPRHPRLRVFGAPIQPPIVHSAPPKKPRP